MNTATKAESAETAEEIREDLRSYLAHPRNLSCRRRKSLRAVLNVGNIEQIDQEAYAILEGLERRALRHPDPVQRLIARGIEEFCRIGEGDIAFIRDELVHLMEFKALNTAQIAAITEMETAA